MLPRIPTLAAWNKKNTWSDLIQLSVILFGYYSGGKFTCGYVLSVRSVLLRTYGGPHKKNSYIYIYNATSKSVKNAFRNSDWFFVKSKARSFSSNNSSLCCVAERSKSNGRRRRTSTLHVWSIQTEPVKFSTSPSSNLAPPSTNSQFFFFFFFSCCYVIAIATSVVFTPPTEKSSTSWPSFMWNERGSASLGSGRRASLPSRSIALLARRICLIATMGPRQGDIRRGEVRSADRSDARPTRTLRTNVAHKCVL